MKLGLTRNVNLSMGDVIIIDGIKYGVDTIRNSNRYMSIRNITEKKNICTRATINEGIKLLNDIIKDSRTITIKHWVFNEGYEEIKVF